MTPTPPDLPPASLPAVPAELAPLLESLGCPAARSAEMAGQLDKRARQLAARPGRSYEQALAHLLGLLRQGWAAQEHAPAASSSTVPPRP